MSGFRITAQESLDAMARWDKSIMDCLIEQADRLNHQMAFYWWSDQRGRDYEEWADMQRKEERTHE